MTLLNELPTHTLGYPFGNTFKIIVYFLMPPIVLLLIYLNLIIADISLVVLHFSEDNPKWATSTILLVCWPAIAGFIFTIATPSLWPGEKPMAKENFKFLGIQLLHFGLFPLGVFYRYVYQIFWAVEAMFANLRRDEIRREEALTILMQPNTMELYFFFQAYLHCAPQILLQFYIMFRIYKPYSDTVRIQLLSIAACLLKMAVTTMSYQRFERRKVLGVEYPWSIYRRNLMKQFSEEPFKPKPVEPELISNIVGIDLSRYSAAPTVRIGSSSDCDSIHKPPLSDTSTIVASDDEEGDESKRLQAVEEVDSDNEFYNDDVFHRVQNSPSPAQKEVDYNLIELDETYKEEEARDEEEQGRPKKKLRVSIVENSDVEKRRKSNLRNNIVDMSSYVTPPATPAPRMSIQAIKERIVTNAEMIMEKIPQRTYKDHEDIALPVRIRQNAIKGIAQEDGVAKFVAFLSWWIFITVRMLSIATFSFFYFEPSIYLCTAHYILMVFCLLCNSWNESIYRKFFYLFLGYVYLFCIIEFKMKFRKVRLWYGLYFALITCENFFMLAVWFWNGTWDVWWFGYIAIVILFGSFLSYMSFLNYFLLLKPKPVTVYPLLSAPCLSPATIQ